MARSFLTTLTLFWLVLASASHASEIMSSSLSRHKTVAVNPVAPKPSKPESKAPSWQQLNAAQKQLLSELAPQWDQQPDRLRNGLVKVANKYPKMKPEEQERVRRRITRWASLTPEQREAARRRFQQIKKQPPEKQKEVKKKWEKYKAEQKAPANTPLSTAGTDPKNAAVQPISNDETE